MVARCMDLWRLSAERYRTIVERYEQLYAEVRRLRLTGHGKAISKRVKDDLPRVRLFERVSEDEALLFLSCLNCLQLKRVLDEALMALDSYEYRTISTRVSEYGYKVRNAGRGRGTFTLAMDPDYTTRGRSRRSRRYSGV